MGKASCQAALPPVQDPQETDDAEAYNQPVALFLPCYLHHVPAHFSYGTLGDVIVI